jgi:hypothetical protein
MRKNKFKEDQPTAKLKSNKFDYLHKAYNERKKNKLFSDLSTTKQIKSTVNISNDSSPVTNKVIIDNKIKLNKVAYSEIVHVIKEEDHFPLKLSNKIPLKTIIFYYNKLWNGELETDSDNIESDSDL